MRRLVLLLSMALTPLYAQAAWFCGAEPTEFARNRASRTLAPFYVDSDRITFGGRQMQSMIFVCEADKDGHQSCHTESSGSSAEIDWTADVDAYEAQVDAIGVWAERLEDGCLSDAYRDIVASHKKIISKDRRAIEFMKSPAPLTIPKGGS